MAPADLAVHQRVQSGQRPYKCQCCDKTFVASWDLRCHMLVHSGLRPFSCMECGKSFTERSSLNKHRRVHSGERPYKCQLCFKSFVVSSSLLHSQPLPSLLNAVSPSGSEPTVISLTVSVTVPVSAFQTMPAHMYIDKEEGL
uniref:C2H2-type domain-containing protein n=1 Tax=Cyprinus carpio TaxID=7962 RepID=A0A8C1TPA4_CYPCA